jgi:hypothetical protein
MKRFATTLVLLALCCTGCGMDLTPTADEVQARETAKARAEANKQVGMPDITKWTELKLARDLYELRDKNLPTYCYLFTLNGDLIYLGEAIGYGLPASVQFSSPEKEAGKHVNGGVWKLPQSEPNGLFMPEGLDATYVLLKDPETGKVKPVYIEPKIIVSPFKLHVERVAVK